MKTSLLTLLCLLANSANSSDLDFLIDDLFVPSTESRSTRAVIQPKVDYDHPYTYDPYLNGEHEKPSYGKGPAFRIPVERRKQFPRLFGPFPLGFTFRDGIRNFPDNSILLLSASVVIPFLPFGVFELRLPVGLFVNYFIDRLNGVETARSGGRFGRSVIEADQADFYALLEDLLSQTFALDGSKCVQRLICELAEEPLNERSLMGEVLHSVMEPRSAWPGRKSDPYVEAQLQGHRKIGQCAKMYKKCPFVIKSFILNNYQKDFLN